jgi:hypothetical protein
VGPGTLYLNFFHDEESPEEHLDLIFGIWCCPEKKAQKFEVWGLNFHGRSLKNYLPFLFQKISVFFQQLFSIFGRNKTRVWIRIHCTVVTFTIGM